MPSQSSLRPGRYDDLELIETFRFQPGWGFVFLNRHLTRMAASAQALGFAFSPGEAKTLLDELETGISILRVRMTLNSSGQIRISSQPFVQQPAESFWQLKVATERIGSTDPLLRHKTSRRTVYDAARAEFSAEEADEILLLNERDEVCEGTITSLFVHTRDGKMLTPSLECGLLAGVLRQEMLENHNVTCARLSLADLRIAASIYVGNSLRGLIRAKLVQ